MTVSGGIDVVWPGLRITENRSGWGSHRFKGVKGEGKGVLGFKDVSGRVELRGEQGVVVVGGSQGVRPGRVGNEDEEEGERGGREEDTETETETEGAEEGLLTPQSEAGDEWMLVQ